MNSDERLLQILKNTIGSWDVTEKKMKCAPISDKDLIAILNLFLFDENGKPIDNLSIRDVRELLLANRLKHTTCGCYHETMPAVYKYCPHCGRYLKDSNGE